MRRNGTEWDGMGYGTEDTTRRRSRKGDFFFFISSYFFFFLMRGVFISFFSFRSCFSFLLLRLCFSFFFFFGLGLQDCRFGFFWARSRERIYKLYTYFFFFLPEDGS